MFAQTWISPHWDGASFRCMADTATWPHRMCRARAPRGATTLHTVRPTFRTTGANNFRHRLILACCLTYATLADGLSVGEQSTTIVQLKSTDNLSHSARKWHSFCPLCNCSRLTVPREHGHCGHPMCVPADNWVPGARQSANSASNLSIHHRSFEPPLSSDCQWEWPAFVLSWWFVSPFPASMSLM